MSRFYASIRGDRAEATRRGTKASGIAGHVRGWNVGVRVTCFVDADGRDVCRVELTGGSVDPSAKKLVGDFTAEDLEEELR